VLDKVMRQDGDLERATRFSRTRLPWTIVEEEKTRENIEMAIGELDPEDAAEEYECLRGGSTSDTFSAKLILQQTHPLPPLGLLEWEPGGPCVAGFDVGKSRHPSVLSMIEKGSDQVWRQTVLHEPKTEAGDNMTLPDQHVLLRNLLTRAKALTLVVDAGGIGAHIAQALRSEFGDRVIEMMVGSRPKELPGQSKIDMVTELKRGLEARELELCVDREQAQQFRRTRIKQGGAIEQPGSARETHYDRFWAMTYAWYGATADQRSDSIYNSKKLVVLGMAGDQRRW
jgi:phage FluMu gp28-like protein